MKYEEALETINRYNPITIKLTVGNKQFKGVEFIQNDFNDIAEDINGYYQFVDPPYERYLLIKVSPEDIKFLDGSFDGKTYDIHGESEGDDFKFMGIGPKRKRSDVAWSSKEWTEYKNKKPDFKVVKLK